MADWLVKTEPGDYSFEDLRREKETVWTGVKNPVALKNLRAMKTGDRVIVYHTGDEKSAVGAATVTAFEENPKNATEPRVVLRAAKPLPRPIPLKEIKSLPLFSDSPLVRIGRLSVVPLTAAQYGFLSGG
ncbi:MAG: EVE domain-containing protein [Thermoanaerobaculia bacterium]|nr:EVE domain-containing protein [Thermoanaerobaculia bacterium]